MPQIGPFFYGPDPGPCSQTIKSNSTYSTTFTYQAGKLRSSQQTQEGMTGVESTSTYAVDAEGRIESIKTGTDTTVFEYGSDYLLDTTTIESGTRVIQVRYALSSSGYPTSAIIMSGTGKSNELLRYDYVDCRLVTRVSLDSSGNVLGQLNYTYDAAGHVASRLDSENYGDSYDYTCWR
jgi:hypothetical protein